LHEARKSDLKLGIPRFDGYRDVHLSLIASSGVDISFGRKISGAIRRQMERGESIADPDHVTFR
jgi:hypothetical protein